MMVSALNKYFLKRQSTNPTHIPNSLEIRIHEYNIQFIAKDKKI